MKKNKIYLTLGIFILLFSLFLVSAENTVCCEKLELGQRCQNVPIEQCSADSQKDFTSCEFTNYCQLGTCYNSQDGTCLDRVPKVICDEKNGVWDSLPIDEVSACKLGCCANLGLLSTEVQCNSLSSDYGVEINFRGDVQDEIECALIKGIDKKGACVIETETRRTCQFLSQGECAALENQGFYEDFLCSDETVVKADCGPSEKTICVDAKDDVYFLDSCGNLANIYNSNRQRDPNYWSKVIQPDDSCDENSGSKSCGNCNSLSLIGGTTCQAKERGDELEMGDYICKDLGCEYKNKFYKHGEIWCDSPREGVDTITDKSQTGDYEPNQDYKKSNLPGSNYARLLCFNGEVTTEPCSTTRQEVCIESEVATGFRYAVCKMNFWQDCMAQGTKDDCLDRNKRNCNWFSGERFDRSEEGEQGYCVSVFAPGFDFWQNEGGGEEICSIGNAQCEYEITKTLLEDPRVNIGAECVELGGEDGVSVNIVPSWEMSMADRCGRIGDCGDKTNYLGHPGQEQTFIEKVISYI